MGISGIDYEDYLRREEGKIGGAGREGEEMVGNIIVGVQYWCFVYWSI